MREIGDDDATLEIELASPSHDARAVLAETGVYPAPRSELPNPLIEVSAHDLAS